MVPLEGEAVGTGVPVLPILVGFAEVPLHALDLAAAPPEAEDEGGDHDGEGDEDEVEREHGW